MKIKKVEKRMERVKVLNTEEERGAFARYASEVPEDGVIVDIGTAAGGSAFVFALTSPLNAKVYTIDPSKNEDFLRLRKEWGLEDKLTFIEKTSEEVAKGWDKEIDLLFIDGIHNYLGVMNDFNWFFPSVKKGGIIIFHDYFLYGNTIGVAVDEICSGGKVEKVEIIDSCFKEDVRTGMYIARKL